MPATTQGKQHALAALAERRAKSKDRKPFDNSSLPAGAPMFFLCLTCATSSASRRATSASRTCAPSARRSKPWAGWNKGATVPSPPLYSPAAALAALDAFVAALPEPRRADARVWLDLAWRAVAPRHLRLPGVFFLAALALVLVGGVLAALRDDLEWWRAAGALTLVLLPFTFWGATEFCLGVAARRRMRALLAAEPDRWGPLSRDLARACRAAGGTVTRH